MKLLLIDEREIDTADLAFDGDSYHFYLLAPDGSKEDVTDNIKQSDKVRIIKGFDKERDTIRVSNERGASKGKSYDQRTGTLGIMTDNIAKDGPVKPVLDAVDNTVKQVFASSGVQSLVIAGFVAVLFVVYFKD